MHIPDGYLGPKTCIAFYAVMAPVWYIASSRAQKSLKAAQLPILALGAAFTFVIMMFNIPVPGGSSGHMVGAVVVAIALGPWAGVVAMTLTLTLQAFLFGDGGLTALAANSFNMGVVMSFSGYYVYRVIAAGPAPSPKRRAIASAVAAYVAINLAAFAVVLELGVQPGLEAGLGGAPLYAPYPLSVTLPAMMATHLVFFGPVEALGTALVVSYAHKFNDGAILEAGKNASWKPLWAALIALIILTPLGLFASGTPWGEWGAQELGGIVGFIPSGMREMRGLWKGAMPGRLRRAGF
ncbi:MAG: cobalt transporter CbiM [Deltaproteobacteria bacterium]|nr:cobalt transporter CbiM [Deltaproteobacteria bacterium]